MSYQGLARPVNRTGLPRDDERERKRHTDTDIDTDIDTDRQRQRERREGERTVWETAETGGERRQRETEIKKRGQTDRQKIARD